MRRVEQMNEKEALSHWYMTFTTFGNHFTSQTGIYCPARMNYLPGNNHGNVFVIDSSTTATTRLR